ncbi:hypothetical protein CUMW_287620 [Citrus unshiu]|uniref:Uncharacterized protein n=1 Tax=Citrus unshiu TaxID=55188 RepID=A0A2H5N069_CITUN|nr:hypothetical protein CUMW_287620 [Citrus unshiu]
MGVERFSLKISARLDGVARMEPEGCRLEHSKWIPLFVGSKVALQCNDCSRSRTLGLALDALACLMLEAESTLGFVCGSAVLLANSLSV